MCVISINTALQYIASSQRNCCCEAGDSGYGCAIYPSTVRAEGEKDAMSHVSYVMTNKMDSDILHYVISYRALFILSFLVFTEGTFGKRKH